MPANMSDKELQTRLHSQDFLSSDKEASTDDNSLPSRKPSVPPRQETGSDANSMNRLMKGAAAESPKLNASSLKSDHPYGDGNHSEMPSQTMIRLGSGTQYRSR